MSEMQSVDIIRKNIFRCITDIEKIKATQSDNIRYAGPVMDEKEVSAAVGSLIDGQLSGWFGFGEKGTLFEKALAEFLHIGHAVFTNSGSSANLLSVASLVSQNLVKPEDEAITPATTFPTTINPLLLYGIKPHFIDIVMPSYTINLDQLENAITDKTKLIMIPHINGSANDMKTIMKLARKHGLYVIEDCCDAFASMYDGRYVGTYGHMSTFSFYVAHHFTTGEGGAVMTNSERLHQTSRSLRDWGRAPVDIEKSPQKKRKLSFQKSSKALPSDYESRYTYINIGYNLKPMDLQGAIGLEQLKKVPAFTKARKENYRFLYDSLISYSDSLILPEGLPKSDNSWFVFPLVVSKKARFKRRKIIQYLEKTGIETRPILAGNITKHPAYSKFVFKRSSNLDCSNHVLNDGFFIGVYPGITENQRHMIAKAFSDFFSSEV